MWSRRTLLVLVRANRRMGGKPIVLELRERLVAPCKRLAARIVVLILFLVFEVFL